MKTRYKFLWLLVAGLCIAPLAWAQVTLTRLDKTIELNGKQQLQLDTEYGNVHIIPWDKPHLQLTITLEGAEGQRKRMEAYADQIKVAIAERAEAVVVKTDFMDHPRGLNMIYKAMVPQAMPVSVEGKFTHVFLGDMESTVALDLEYSMLQGGSYTEDFLLDMGFSSASLDNMGECRVVMRYSHIDLGDALKVVLEGKDSNITAERIEHMQVLNKYGNIEIGEVDRFVGEIKYGNLDVDQLNEELVLVAEHCGKITLRDVSETFKKISTDLAYSNLYLGMRPNALADLNAHLEYGDLQDYHKLLNLTKVYDGPYTKFYKGSLGRLREGQLPTGQIRIIGKYSDVKIKLVEN